MEVFSTRINIPAGSTLAGYQDRIDVPTTVPGELQAHGIVFERADAGASWELCAVDALYAGALASAAAGRMVAASHTHYAPMIDPGKPRLGRYSASTVAAFERAISAAPRIAIEPDNCVLLRAEVALPVYRRFDHPDTWLNRQLTRRAGFFPNDAQPVDRGLYLLVFRRGDQAVAVIAHHACHPMTRADARRASGDYVQAVRAAVVERLGTPHCVFLLGCNGDVRPNFAEKRKVWLPRIRLNWRFKRTPTALDQEAADSLYREAVLRAEPIDKFSFGPDDARLSSVALEFPAVGALQVPRLDLGGRVAFTFMPYEVSHRYRIEAIARDGHPRGFIVSCAGDTRGYLPHPSQLRAGGYEVLGSRLYMGRGHDEMQA